jgi:mono/diheme cytochrome c family protein
VLGAVGFIGYVYAASYRQMSKTYAVTVPPVAIPSDASAIARGKYLVENVSMCVECHGSDLGGKVVEDNFMMGRLVAPKLLVTIVFNIPRNNALAKVDPTSAATYQQRAVLIRDWRSS